MNKLAFSCKNHAPGPQYADIFTLYEGDLEV